MSALTEFKLKSLREFRASILELKKRSTHASLSPKMRR
jgi:hypothetical protein